MQVYGLKFGRVSKCELRFCKICHAFFGVFDKYSVEFLVNILKSSNNFSENFAGLFEKFFFECLTIAVQIQPRILTRF